MFQSGLKLFSKHFKITVCSSECISMNFSVECEHFSNHRAVSSVQYIKEHRFMVPWAESALEHSGSGVQTQHWPVSVVRACDACCHCNYRKTQHENKSARIVKTWESFDRLLGRFAWFGWEIFTYNFISLFLYLFLFICYFFKYRTVTWLNAARWPKPRDSFNLL